MISAVLRHGREEPEKLAVALKRSRITYGELRRHILAAAKSLRDNYGLKRGDLVIISAISKSEYVIATLAAQFLGATTVPADKAARESAWADLLEIVQPKLVITDAPLKNWFGVKVSMRKLCAAAAQSEESCSDEECVIPSPDDPAEIIFTTGTTGKPKGTILTYRGVEASTRNTWNGIGMLPSDRVLNPLPLHHSFGMRVLRATLWGGASLILQNGFTFAKDLEENLETYQCTGFTAVPATVETLYRSMGDRFVKAMARLRYIEIGAGFMSADMKKKLIAALPNTELFNNWGSSETGGVFFFPFSRYPDKASSLGRPISGVEFKAVDENGETVEAVDVESAGRMALRGPMRMAGYFRNPKETAKAISGDWLFTNDLVYRDADGFIYMLGRADDIINVGGDKVSPVEIEEAAQEFEEIRECACIGVEDPEGVYGMVPALFVVPEGAEFHEEACEKFLLGRLERWKLPRRYLTLTALPRNRMQKLNRKALREIYERGGERHMNEAIQNILTRRSIRDFTNRPVTRDILETLLECGMQAPSGHNMQTWRFTVLQDAARIAALKTTARDVAKRNKVYFYGFNNPVALILVSNDRRNRDGVQDCSCAAQNIMLAAHSLGLGSVWLNPLMTICDEPEIRSMLRAFDVPDEHIVWATIALGYPAQEGRLLEKKRDVVHWVDETMSNSSIPP